jgi:predicted amidohydrolase
MKVGFCQFNVLHKEIEGNLEKIGSLLSGKKAELMVLPELCLSGYYFSNKKELAKLSNSENHQKMMEGLQKIAQINNTVLIVGIAEIEGNDLFNTAVVIGPNGLIGKHRKVNISKNEKIFSRGTDFEIIEINNVKIGIAICFDCWFPESFRLLSMRGAQIICCPTNFGGPMTLDVIKVRSLENAVFAIIELEKNQWELKKLILGEKVKS